MQNAAYIYMCIYQRSNTPIIHDCHLYMYVRMPAQSTQMPAVQSYHKIDNVVASHTIQLKAAYGKNPSVADNISIP